MSGAPASTVLASSCRSDLKDWQVASGISSLSEKSIFRYGWYSSAVPVEGGSFLNTRDTDGPANTGFQFLKSSVLLKTSSLDRIISNLFFFSEQPGCCHFLLDLLSVSIYTKHSFTAEPFRLLLLEHDPARLLYRPSGGPPPTRCGPPCILGNDRLHHPSSCD